MKSDLLGLNGPNPEELRVAHYVRVSTDEQRDKGTIQQQVTALEKHSEWRGYNVVELYEDNGVSGGDPIHKRPAGGRLVADAQAGRIDRVLINELDRLGRDTLDILGEVERLRRRGVEVESVKEGYVFDESLVGKLLLSLLSTIAEVERAKTRDRTKRGREAGREARKIVNPNIYLYGYDLQKRDGDSPTTYVVNAGQAEVVRLIFELYVTTHRTVRSVVEYMERSGHRPPRSAVKWGRTTVKKILSNPAYIGEYWQGKWEVTYSKPDPDDLTAKPKRSMRLKGREDWESYVEIDPIIDRLTWEKAQALLETNAARSARNRKNNYLLSGKVTCSTCRGRMYGNASKGLLYYRCYKRDKASLKPGEERCASRDVRADKIEAEAYHLVVRYLADPEALLRDQEGNKARRQELKRDLDAAERALARLDTKVRRNLELLEDADEGEIGHLGARRKELAGERKALAENRDRLLAEAASVDLKEAQLAQLRDAAPDPERDSPELRERFLNEYVEEVIVEDGRLTDVWGSLLLDGDEKEVLAEAKRHARGIPAAAIKGGLNGDSASLGVVKELLDEVSVSDKSS